MEIKVLFHFMRLMGAILLEGMASILQMGMFLLRRGAERERVLELMLRAQSAPRPEVLRSFAALGEEATVARVRRLDRAVNVSLVAGPVLAGAVLAGIGLAGTVASALAGCSPLEHRKPTATESMPGTHLGKQMDQLAWSTRSLLDMSDAQRSLESDLEDFGSGTSLPVAASDLGALLWDPDSQASLEETLEIFGTSEPDDLVETLFLLGW